jgi:hypothetical protein
MRNAFANTVPTRAVFGKASKFKLCLISLVSAEGMPSTSIFNILNCQPNVKAHFDPQRVIPALSNPIVERDDGRFQIGLHDDASGPFETRCFAEAVAIRGCAMSGPPERKSPTTGDGSRARSISWSFRNTKPTIQTLVEGRRVDG